ncbi:MAG: hypothetical protein IKS24_01060 [Bacteroidaceae bacterium]|nr:hypothetical protein [Bacteroidaceae bacterium]
MTISTIDEPVNERLLSDFIENIRIIPYNTDGSAMVPNIGKVYYKQDRVLIVQNGGGSSNRHLFDSKGKYIMDLCKASGTCSRQSYTDSGKGGPFCVQNHGLFVSKRKVFVADSDGKVHIFKFNGRETKRNTPGEIEKMMIDNSRVNYFSELKKEYLAYNIQNDTVFAISKRDGNSSGVFTISMGSQRMFYSFNASNRYIWMQDNHRMQDNMIYDMEGRKIVFWGKLINDLFPGSDVKVVGASAGSFIFCLTNPWQMSVTDKCAELLSKPDLLYVNNIEEDSDYILFKATIKNQ